MNEYFKKYIGGISFMFSILLLLIGITHYQEILINFNNDTSASINYIKTKLLTPTKKSPAKKQTFDIGGDGEIIRTFERNDDTLTYHYRALPVPNLKNNYEAFPQLKLEVVEGGQKKMIPIDIYKIDREKGLIYFLLKISQGHKVALTNLYTGVYDVSLIK